LDRYSRIVRLLPALRAAEEEAPRLEETALPLEAGASRRTVEDEVELRDGKPLTREAEELAVREVRLWLTVRLEPRLEDEPREGKVRMARDSLDRDIVPARPGRPEDEPAAPLRLMALRSPLRVEVPSRPEGPLIAAPEPKTRPTWRARLEEKAAWACRAKRPVRSMLGAMLGWRAVRLIWPSRDMWVRSRANWETWGDCSWLLRITVRARL
jgi:hypothetical protein